MLSVFSSACVCFDLTGNVLHTAHSRAHHLTKCVCVCVFVLARVLTHVIGHDAFTNHSKRESQIFVSKRKVAYASQSHTECIIPYSDTESNQQLYEHAKLRTAKQMECSIIIIIIVGLFCLAALFFRGAGRTSTSS